MSKFFNQTGKTLETLWDTGKDFYEDIANADSVGEGFEEGFDWAGETITHETQYATGIPFGNMYDNMKSKWGDVSSVEGEHFYDELYDIGDFTVGSVAEAYEQRESAQLQNIRQGVDGESGPPMTDNKKSNDTQNQGKSMTMFRRYMNLKPQITSGVTKPVMRYYKGKEVYTHYVHYDDVIVDTSGIFSNLNQWDLTTRPQSVFLLHWPLQDLDISVDDTPFQFAPSGIYQMIVRIDAVIDIQNRFEHTATASQNLGHPFIIAARLIIVYDNFRTNTPTGTYSGGFDHIVKTVRNNIDNTTGFTYDDHESYRYKILFDERATFNSVNPTNVQWPIVIDNIELPIFSQGNGDIQYFLLCELPDGFSEEFPDARLLKAKLNVNYYFINLSSTVTSIQHHT